ncbi:hypothetical protein Gohar_014843 [Gossypium harknessii]|uniref:Homologous recombination OB-fold protein OB-fold domain-containing protein n=1 Tax=Gossypium harknessii TaxID=34285 RepID=A0A7J9FYF7_9ROSI|nr:hypothetical protein [Gossypium harknessii]
MKGLVDNGGTIGTPLSWIKTEPKLGNRKVAQVVAIIKSCTPNGLGDLMVTLKDPTGTIDASIHGKVLVDGRFAKDITVGTVLILQKVSVFSPMCSARYLNITLNNVVKSLSRSQVILWLAIKTWMDVVEVGEEEIRVKKQNWVRYDVGPKNCLVKFMLGQDRTKIEVANFLGKMHVENYFDWEASLENYFEWKPLVEARKLTFVKLKLKGTMLQWLNESNEQMSSYYLAGLSQYIKMRYKRLAIPKDTEPLSELNHTSRVISTANGIGNTKETWNQQKVSSLSPDRNANIMDNLGQTGYMRRRVLNDNGNEADATLGSRCCVNGRNRSQNGSAGKEPSTSQVITNGMEKAALLAGINGLEENVVVKKQPGSQNLVGRDNHQKSKQSSGDPNLFGIANERESVTIDADKERRDVPISRGSLPQWTDEQLDELCSFD